ncbi:MAG TPA: ATP-binding protein [Nakamurella sp.]
MTRWLAFGVPAVIAYNIAALWPMFSTQLWLAVSTVVVSVTFFATGIFIATDTGHRATAAALLASALLWPLNWLNEWEVGPLPVMAALEGPLASLPAIWAFLRYPRPWPRRWQELTVVWVLVCIQLQAVVVVLTSRPEWNGWPPDQPWPTLWPDYTAFAVGSWLQDVGGAVLAGGAAALMVLRLTRLTGPDRRLMRPVVVALPVVAALTAAGNLGNAFNVEPALEYAIYAVESVALVGVPVAFLIAAVRRWLARESVPRLIRLLGTSPTAEQVQTAVGGLLGDPSLRLLYRGPAGYVDISGQPAVPPDPGSPHRIAAVTLDADPDAVIVVGDPVLQRHPELVTSVTRAAALTLENSRLAALERAQIEQVSRSAQRLTAAVAVEQRRVQTAVDHIVRVNLAVVVGQLHALSAAPALRSVRQDIDTAADGLESAQGELLQMAGGAAPALLLRQGLAAAVTMAASHLGHNASVMLPTARFHAQTENAAYFAVCELLANAVKHAPRATLSVSGANGPDWLLIDVRDNGAGGADPQGSGLRGLARRLEQLGGRLTLNSPLGGGTAARIRLPLEPAPPMT